MLWKEIYRGRTVHSFLRKLARRFDPRNDNSLKPYRFDVSELAIMVIVDLRGLKKEEQTELE